MLINHIIVFCPQFSHFWSKFKFLYSCIQETKIKNTKFSAHIWAWAWRVAHFDLAQRSLISQKPLSQTKINYSPLNGSFQRNQWNPNGSEPTNTLFKIFLLRDGALNLTPRLGVKIYAIKARKKVSAIYYPLPSIEMVQSQPF